MNVDWAEQSEAQQKSVGLHVIQPNLPVLWFPRSSVGTHNGNEKPPALRFPRFGVATHAAAAITLLLCTACQPAFIGVDSDADVAAENCYAYRYGDKLRQINFAQAFDWCHRSARLSNANSQALLGELYYLGLGSEADFQQAAHWFELAARQGHSHAQYMLYRILVVSNDVAEREKAEYWLHQARSSGYKLTL